MKVDTEYTMFHLYGWIGKCPRQVHTGGFFYFLQYGYEKIGDSYEKIVDCFEECLTKLKNCNKIKLFK